MYTRPRLFTRLLVKTNNDFTNVKLFDGLKSFEILTLRQMIAIIILFYYNDVSIAFYFNYNGPRVRKQAVVQCCVCFLFVCVNS